ncbi:hypothetical protein A9P82_07960 [Arachidicoccus ginsenosidimutans]|uniref:hypothetical protein n=1 Tax=Arachidicoccus sp. BS20 TaxID=1850526 RepID=UPI0007F05D0C|nr:hypothetical protein [Arachidicoccus sp. BS20]ANI89231.1 hypothetical protein A9P82_07960 [Arachidicoccus sp. BS20]
MKNIIKSVIAGGLAIGALNSCSKSEPTLNTSAPAASFTYNMLTPTSDSAAQNLELINTSTNSMTGYWNVTDNEGKSIGTYTGDTVKLAIVFAGTYNVKMAAAGPGGLSDTVQQTVTIDKDNPFAVGPTTLLGILTGSGIGKTQRAWVPTRVTATVTLFDSYADVLSAMDAGGGGAWYYFGQYGELATDGTGRDAYFDDTTTFVFNKAGNLAYNDGNTIYVDGNGSPWTRALNPALGAGNYNSATFAANYPADKAWTSGNFTYTVAPAPAGAMGLGTVTVNGIGAHLGLPDKSNTVEQVTPTLPSVTYDVLRVSLNQTDAGGTYDEIIFGVDVADVGATGNWWGFKYKSYR